MRVTGIVCIGLLVITCAAQGQRGKRDETGAVNRACTAEECFREADVRDFEVIDKTHLIVFVGQQRCAFQVELRGAFCDMTFAPEVNFRRQNEVPIIYTQRPRGEFEEPSGVVPRANSRNMDPLEQQQRERRDLLVCDNDLTVQVNGGVLFTESAAQDLPTDRFGNPRSDCSVSSVRGITDDQLVELYVGHKVVPPLPPMGSGEIEVGEQEEQGAAPAEAPPADSGEATGRRSRR
jgi:hypothetical protein